MASRISKAWLIWVILIVLVLALAGGALSCNSFSPSEALNFTLPTLTGANITLSELKGTPVVLNFWATWCPHCGPELPYFEAVAQQSAGGIKVIAIDVGESNSTVQKFFGSYEPTMIVALDSNGKTFVNYCRSYGNSQGYIPFTLFVDSQGMVQRIRIGEFSSETELWNTIHDVFGITIP